MPLRVHCPSGCLVRMPSNRAEKVVRCPNCKMTIKIPAVPASEKNSGKPIPIHAILVDPQPTSAPLDAAEIVEDESPKAIANVGIDDLATDLTTNDSDLIDSATQAADSNPSKDLPADDVPATNLLPRELPNIAQEKPSEQPTKKPSKKTTKTAAAFDSAFDSTVEETSTTEEDPASARPPQPRLTMPATLSPAAIKKSKDDRKAELQQILSAPEQIVEFKHIEVDRTKRKRKRRKWRPAPPPVANVQDPTLDQDPQDEEISWEARLQESNADRVVLARFFGFALCVVAFINMVPAFYHWNDWYQAVETTQLPRWIYLQMFVAAIHIIYAVFLFQIPRWSAMRAVSVAMLVVAFIFGVVSAGLLIGGGQGIVAAFLGLSFVMVKRAAIWCVVMLILATLTSYLGGRESANWQRAEILLEEILTGNSRTTEAPVSNKRQKNTSAQTS